MKKTIVYLAVSSSLIGAAHAQTSVTLYGIVDQGLSYFSNAATGDGSGHPVLRLVSGVMQQSRFGLRGSEDLGAGLKTIFVLENGFDASSGKLAYGGLLFGKRSFVGLSNNYGTVTLGRQYDTNVDFVGPFESGTQWGGYTAAHPGDLDNLNNNNSINNSIKLVSNSVGGFSIGALIGLGGVAGDFARNRVWSLSAGYTGGSLALGAGYLYIQNPNTAFFGNGGSPAPTVAGVTGNNIATPVYSGYASAHALRIIAAGGSYTMGPAVVGATYSNTSFRDLGDTASGPNPRRLSGSASFNNAELNARYQITAALLAGISYDYTRGSALAGEDPAKYHQFNAGIDYFLSKRTDLYLIAIYQKASGMDSTGKRAVAAINGPSASSTDKQAMVRVGIRHKF